MLGFRVVEITAAKLSTLLKTGRVNGNPFHRYLVAKLLFKCKLPAFVKFSTDHYRLWFHPSELSYQLYQNRSYFRQDEAIMDRILRPGDVFVDIGANIGTWVLYAAHLVGPAGHVYAFEPHPKTAHYLQRNVALNSFQNITIFSCAVGDSHKLVTLEETANDTMNNISENGTVSVQMVPLDSMTQIPKIRLLKIDAEGSELQILHGAIQTLERTESVCMECCDTYARKRGYRSLDLLKILLDQGFKTDLPRDHSETFDENVLAFR